MTTHSSSPAMEHPRSVLRGRVEGDLYVITIDGNEEIETTNQEIATSLADAKRAGRSVEVDLTRADGKRAVVTEVRVMAAETTPAAKAAAAPPAAGQALVKAPDVPEGLIITPHELAQQLERFRSHYNVLSPAIQISQLAPGYGANLSLVPMDASVNQDGQGSDTYFNSKIMKDGERALGKIGLVRIAQAAGIQWIPEHCRRTDDGRQMNLWRWQYFGVYRAHDGTVQQCLGSAEADLRDGSAEIQGWSAPQVKQQRSKGNEICETKAMLRAIRSLGIKQKYTLEELKRPFVVVRFSFTPDMSDPEIKKLVTEQAMRGLTTLYAAPPALPVLPAHPDGPDDVDEPAAPTRNAPAAATPTTKPRATDPFAEPTQAALPPDATFVAKFEKADGTNAKTGRKWTRYTVTFENGQIASTFSETLQQLVLDAKKEHLPVRITTSEVENYDDKLESLTILDPKQPMLPGAAEKY